mmetsp:Transcript_3942/g.8884  ORF Transcript_3942/g.8884 Transcript_3942/m.8884 type:complete len:126 (+) Transcript_3942:769-1146(+)
MYGDEDSFIRETVEILCNPMLYKCTQTSTKSIQFNSIQFNSIQFNATQSIHQSAVLLFLQIHAPQRPTHSLTRTTATCKQSMDSQTRCVRYGTVRYDAHCISFPNEESIDPRAVVRYSNQEQTVE